MIDSKLLEFQAREAVDGISDIAAHYGVFAIIAPGVGHNFHGILLLTVNCQAEKQSNNG